MDLPGISNQTSIPGIKGLIFPFNSPFRAFPEKVPLHSDLNRDSMWRNPWKNPAFFRPRYCKNKPGFASPLLDITLLMTVPVFLVGTAAIPVRFSNPPIIGDIFKYL